MGRSRYGKLQDDFELDSLRLEDFPEEMQAMSADEKAQHLHQKRAAREDIQGRIAALSMQREEYLKEVRASNLQSRGLDEAMKDAIRQQAKAKGFLCDEC